MISMDYNIPIMGLLSFIAILIAIVSGWVTIRKNLKSYTQDVINWQVALEHRLTKVEINVQWIKENLPRRKGDIS